MASQPEKVQLHRERERVLALSRLFAPDPERSDAIAAAARELPLPDGLAYRLDAARELMGFLGSSFADVRRLAASALGKMVPERPVAAMFVSRLAELARGDAHPQVRQYALKALARYPKDARLVIETLKDVAREEGAPAYVRTAAAEAVAAVQEAARKQHGLNAERYFCRRCHRHVTEAEFQASMERWGRTYCRHCADEIDLYIEYYGMDTPEYNANRQRKHILYQRAAKKLISVSFRDDANLIDVLRAKLSRYIRLEEKT